MPMFNIPEPSISEFKAGLRGNLIRRDDAGYDYCPQDLQRDDRPAPSFATSAVPAWPTSFQR